MLSDVAVPPQLPSAACVERSSALTEQRYGLAFVQNFVIIGSLRIAVLGVFALTMIWFMPQPSAYGFMLSHVVLSCGLAITIGVYDAKKRFELIEARLGEYNRLGERYYRLRINLFIHKTDLRFGRDVFKTRLRSREYSLTLLSGVVLLIVSFVPVIVLGDRAREVFKQSFQYSVYPFLVVIGAFTIYRLARFFYWKGRIGPLMKEKYGYSFRDLYVTTTRA